MLERMQGRVNAGPGSDATQETGPAKVAEEVPKGGSQLTKISGDRHLLVRVTGVEVGRPRALLLREPWPPRHELVVVVDAVAALVPSSAVATNLENAALLGGDREMWVSLRLQFS